MLRRNSQSGQLFAAGNPSAFQSMSVLTSFHGQIPFDAPLMTTLPGEPSIVASSTKRSFNIMAKESFKKLMRESNNYNGAASFNKHRASKDELLGSPSIH